MKRILMLFGAIPFLVISCVLVEGQAKKSSSGGTVCVSRVPQGNNQPVSLANTAGGGRRFNFSIQIDDGPIKKTESDSSIALSGLVSGRKHLIKVRKDGQIVQSFRFKFSDYKSNQLCLWYKSLYETWSLSARNEAKGMCDCR